MVAHIFWWVSFKSKFSAQSVSAKSRFFCKYDVCICVRLCICEPNEKRTIFASLRIKSNAEKLKYTSVSSEKDINKEVRRKSIHYSTVRKYFVILPDMRSWTCLVLFSCNVLQCFNFLPISLLWLSYIMHSRAPRTRRVYDFTSCFNVIKENRGLMKDTLRQL